jgi:alkanesulfonate monooxygenase SsuD/methylene tetrahydromethanopterin reductase-like flavin-dependent oxidoreductase (luciferase family)
VFFPDHFDEGPGPIAAMTAAATVTSTLRVGSLVFDCDFRHPAVLARELATIDVISGGRLEVGLGAGWKRSDYDHSGIEMERPGVRVSRLIEHAAVLKGLWGEGPFAFAGEHYTITGLDGTPKPFQPGGPPLVVCGGAPRLLGWA